MLAKWLREGAPSGILRPFDRSGVFPDAPEEGPASAAAVAALAASPDGWVNYRSAEDDPDVCKELLGRMVSEGWAEAFPT